MMKLPQFLIALTVVNIVTLVFSIANLRSASADEVAPILKGRGLQIVDEQGRVRASISVLPGEVGANGTKTPETVLLRLITERGRPSVKISTSEESSVASFVGPSNTKNTYMVLEAKGTESSLKLKDEAGGETLIKPKK
jgi:hypothetical protein